jgi:hypothetical protein
MKIEKSKLIEKSEDSQHPERSAICFRRNGASVQTGGIPMEPEEVAETLYTRRDPKQNGEIDANQPRQRVRNNEALLGKQKTRKNFSPNGGKD